MFKSILKPDTSVLLGIANGAIVMAIYNGAVPSIASVRASEHGDKDIEASRKQAAWTSASVLGFMFLLTRDRNSFLIGGLVLAGTDIMVKHANGWNPMAGMLQADTGETAHLDDDSAAIYPMANYAETSDYDASMG